MVVVELFQMWGQKCEKVRKPWVLRLKLWSLSMRLIKSEESEKGCKCAVVEKIKMGGTCDCIVTHANQFCVFDLFRDWEPVKLM